MASFLVKLSGPFTPPSEPSEKPINIRSELLKLLKAGINVLNPDQINRLSDHYINMNSRNQIRKYKRKHPNEYRVYHLTPTGKQIRLLRYIRLVLSRN